MKMIEGTIAAYVYEDGAGFLGLQEITMPDIEHTTFEMSGLGMMGKANYGVLSQVEPMNMTMSFRDTSSAFYTLSEQRVHIITLEVAKQAHDRQAGEIPVTGIKYVVRCEPTKTTGGSIKPATPQNVSIDFSVFAIQEFVDGKPQRHIDIDNYIDETNGVDRAAPIRKALNMSY